MPTFKKSDIISIEIESLNIRGQGIGFKIEDDIKYSFAVPRAFPGDLVEVYIKKIKKNFVDCDLQKIIRPSKDRVDPINSYAKIAGSTPLELLDYPKQLFYKQNEVKRLLSNVNLKAEISNIKGMLSPSFYRNKMQYSFGKAPDTFEFELGMHHYRYKFRVVEVLDCKLCDPICSPIVKFTKDYFINSNFTIYDFRNGEGDLRNLTIRASKNTDEKMLILEVSNSENLDLFSDYFDKLLKEFKEISSVFLHVTTQVKGQKTKVELIHISGKQTMQEKLRINEKEYLFEILPMAFFQPNTKQAEVIYEQVRAYCNSKYEVIYDLFCGTGTISMILSDKADKVYGVEIEPQSIEVAKQNTKLNKISNIEFSLGDVYKVLKASNFQKPDLVVVDPPRSGLTEKAIDLICDLKPQELIYVSCNIKTFITNALMLEEKGYKLQLVTPIDQFPHTRHLELVTKFTLEK